MSKTRHLIMARLLAAVLAAGGLALVTAPAATAGSCHYGGGAQGNGGAVTGNCHSENDDVSDDDDGDDYVPISGPVYEDYWTPSCSVNGPPEAGSDAMCMGAIGPCQTRGQRGEIFMRHYRKLAGDPNAPWEYVGSECRGPDDPVQQQPQVTQEMVTDAAYAAAPKPTAVVQPGNRSYVNLPNNYYADAEDQTVPVEVLGHQIAVQFTVSDVTWDFGDGTTASGAGVKDADVGAPGAVEHAYSQQGSYAITATSTVGLSFTLPNGQTVNVPGAFEMTSEPVNLPIGEIQTRVDSTS